MDYETGKNFEVIFKELEEIKEQLRINQKNKREIREV